jgi:hypothetical protein
MRLGDGLAQRRRAVVLISPTGRRQDRAAAWRTSSSHLPSEGPAGKVSFRYSWFLGVAQCSVRLSGGLGI